MNFMELRIETFCISKIDPLHSMKNKNVRGNLRFAFPPFPFYATVFDQSDSLKMMTLFGKCKKKEEEKFLCSLLFKRDLLLSATFEEFLDQKIVFLSKQFRGEKRSKS